MDILDDIGTRQVQQIVISLEVLASPIAEALSPKIRLRQLPLLDHRPHRAVNDRDAVLQQAFQLADSVRLRTHLRLPVLLQVRLTLLASRQ